MPGPSIAIRADGGPQTGLGHMGRCLALAQAFRHLGARPVFLDAPETCRPWVQAQGFAAVRSASRRWDILVADSYRFRARDWGNMRRLSRTLLALDDFGTCRAPADWVLNGHVYARSLTFRAPPASSLLLGPKFLPLRQEYWKPSRPRRAPRRIRRLLVCLGGGDSGRLLETALRAARRALPQAEIHAVVGPLAPRPDAAAASRLVWHQGLASLRPLIEHCDGALCAGGQTSYELARAGTPAVLLQRGDDQAGNIRGLLEAGAAFSAGRAAAPGLEPRLRAALLRLERSAALRARLSKRGRGLIDGLGALRVARVLLFRRRSTP